MNILILKFSNVSGNYWGNEKITDGIGFQTFPSIAQSILNVASEGGKIYMCHAGKGNGFFGPMNCSPTFSQKDGFYIFELKGELKVPVRGFLDQNKTTITLKKLSQGAAGVLISNNRIVTYNLNDEQFKRLIIPGNFNIAA